MQQCAEFISCVSETEVLAADLSSDPVSCVVKPLLAARVIPPHESSVKHGRGQEQKCVRHSSFSRFSNTRAA